VRNIFVGNLDFNVSEEQLQTEFAQFGAVERVTIMRDKFTGQPRGFGFVEMADEQAAQQAISSLNGKKIGNRPVAVNEARPREERGPGGGGGRGGHKQGGYGGGRGGGRGGDRGDRGNRW